MYSSAYELFQFFPQKKKTKKKKKNKKMTLSRLLNLSRWQEINGIEEHLKQYQEVAISKNTMR